MFQIIHYIDCPGYTLPEKLCFYIEKDYDGVINSFIKRNYSDLQAEFRAKNMELVYMPMLGVNVGEEVIKYVAGGTVQLNSNVETFKDLLPSTLLDEIDKPCLVHYDIHKKRFEIAPYKEEFLDSPELFLHTFIVEFSRSNRVSYVERYNLSEPPADPYVRYSKRSGSSYDSGTRYSKKADSSSSDSGVRYSSRGGSVDDVPLRSYGQSVDSQPKEKFEIKIPKPSLPHPQRRYSIEVPLIESYKPLNREDKESHELDLENQQIIGKVMDLMRELRERGFSEQQLRTLLAPVQKLSRLTITKEYRFILTDYDNREVKLSPLQKALFVFYLRHPEGVPFKQLVDYKDELKKIYHDVDGWNFVRQNKRIENICNPLRNTVNENVSRIRNAFRAVIDESLAKNYFILGKQGEAMFIPLSRELVVWE